MGLVAPQPPSARARGPRRVRPGVEPDQVRGVRWCWVCSSLCSPPARRRDCETKRFFRRPTGVDGTPRRVGRAVSQSVSAAARPVSTRGTQRAGWAAKQSVSAAARPVSTGRHDALGGGEPKRFYRRPTGVSTGRTRRAGRAVKNPTIAPRLASRPRRYSWDEGVYTGAAVTLGGASRGGAFAVDFAMNRRRATLQLAELQARARTLLCFFARIAFSPPPASELSFPNQRRAGRVEKCLAARANTHRVPPPVSNKKWCARVCGACACVPCSAARSATAGSTSARGA